MIPSLLQTLQVTETSDPIDQCDKGSIWELEPLPADLHATYHPRPDRRTRRAVQYPKIVAAGTHRASVGAPTLTRSSLYIWIADTTLIEQPHDPSADPTIDTDAATLQAVTFGARAVRAAVANGQLRRIGNERTAQAALACFRRPHRRACQARQPAGLSSWK